MGEKAALAVDAKVRDPRRSGCIGSAARFAVVLEVDEDFLLGGFLPLPGDVLESLERAVLFTVAVGEIADGTDLDVLDRFASAYARGMGNGEWGMGNGLSDVQVSCY